MGRQQIYDEMKETFGMVLSYFKFVPHSTLEKEWGLFKAIERGITILSGKEKELIGVGISVGVQCQFGVLFYTEMAKLKGATDAEIEDTLKYTKKFSGRQIYLDGMDYEQFQKEVLRAFENIRDGSLHNVV